MILHDYQALCRDFLGNTPRAGIFLDPGMGKTAATLSALTPEHLPALVVAPKRPVELVWPPERDLWRTDLTMSVATGDPKQRAVALKRGADVTVISRDNLADAVGGPWKTFIADELSSFKERTTNRWKSARQIAERATNCWGLTGTPSPNGLLPLWAQIYLLDQGARLGKNITTYRSRYFRPGRQIANGTIVEWILREGAEDKIHAAIADICLSMEGQGEKPTYNYVPIPMPTNVRKLYKTFKRDLVVDLDLLGGVVHSAGSAATLTNRLSQMTAGFLYSDEQDGTYDIIHKEKLGALEEIVEEVGSPVLVYYGFKAEREMIRKAFPQARGIDERGCIDEWNRGGVPVMLAHPASAGHGLNLQHGGHTAVWTTDTWDLELWIQANMRLPRQGQQHHVVIHVLQMEDSVDLLIPARREDKDNTQTALLDHLRSPM